MQNRQIDKIEIKKEVNNMDKKFKVFGKLVDREEAEQKIKNEIIGDIVGSSNDCYLDQILTCGWTAMYKWSDKEIQDSLDELEIENQWDWKD